jgi:methylmalonyl-CoA/ethylmalonyl-CoA epimerase
MFERFDHVAIVVKNTDEALKFYRDTLGLPLLFSEVMADQKVRLTHLDLGGGHLQLVEPLAPEHPLSEHLRQHGEGLHHLCFRVKNVPEAIAAMPAQGLASRDPKPRSGPGGKQSAFLQPETTRGVLIEVTAPAGAVKDGSARDSAGV